MDLLKTYKTWFLCKDFIKQINIEVQDEKINISHPHSSEGFIFDYKIIDDVIYMIHGESNLIIKKYNSRVLIYEEYKKNILFFRGFLY